VMVTVIARLPVAPRCPSKRSLATKAERPL
jgi:hypothetical protein